MLSSPLVLSLAILTSVAATAQNHPPDAPRITEPTAPNLVYNPFDIHMETAPFADPDAGDQHFATDWEIWTTGQRVWRAAGVTGFEKVHAHLGDGSFENSHIGWSRLFANTQFTLRVRHQDDSGDPNTSWSDWTSIQFWTGPADTKTPLELDDVEASPAPTWTDLNGNPVDLPTGSPHPMLRLETNTKLLLLRIDGDPGPGNMVTNPPILPRHRPVRVVIDAGSRGLTLPPTDIRASEHACRTFQILLPAINLAPFQQAFFWVTAEGATYSGDYFRNDPNFSTPARSLDLPWVPRQPGYSVEVIAGGLRMPVGIAMVPNPGSQPSDPKLYITELYGTIRTVTNDNTVLTYASGLINYTPSGRFPGSGEQGLAGIAVDPATGDVFVSHLWRNNSRRDNYPRITRLRSTNGGRTASSRQVILDMQGESQGQSHQISNVEIVNGELYCHMGDGFNAGTALNLNSYRGKILRLNLDGSPVTSNPFYNGGSRDARDYIFAWGIRNAFGGSWRAADNTRYFVENGPDVDRFAKLLSRSYGWNNSNASMRTHALHTWEPARGPVAIAFVQPQTFGGSGFGPDKMDHAFVTESGPTYARGQQARGKRITEFTLDASGNVVRGPIPFVEYVGDGYATAVGLAAGADGLYFTDFYKDLNTTGPTAIGGRLLRVRRGAADDCNANGEPDWCEIATGSTPDCNGNQVPDECDIRSGTSTDFDQNTIPDECDPLQASVDGVSLAAGGRIDFTLRAGAPQAGRTYLLVGSSTGTRPGTQLGSVVLPLNTVNDPWFGITAALANSGLLPNTLGRFDASGRATAALVMPGNLPVAFLGRTWHHAYVVIDSASFEMASNAVPMTFNR